ncbi:MAG: replicative DNA helicase, partial [Alphaproteobacteria bacterium]|nr:replicative DNA helicase [Alphaproteobacteria bacterium]
MTQAGPAGAGRDLVGLSQRLPPQNAEAEQALLGGLLANNKGYDRVAEILRPEHFADPCHAAVYAAIARRVEAGQVADVVSLRPEFENTGILDPAGGVRYLVDLLTAMVSPRLVTEYAALVRDAWARRCIIDACEEGVNLAFAGTEAHGRPGADDDELAAALLPCDKVAERVIDSFASAIERKGRLAGVTTGFRALDRKLGGLRGGQLVVIGARPSMGKTALAVSIGVRAAAAMARTLFVSAEMSAEEVFKRAVAAVSGIPLPALTSGGGIEPGTNRFVPFEAGGPESRRAAEAAMHLGRLPMQWDEAPRATVSAIRARARRMARAKGGGLDLLVVDYLGRCRGSPEIQRAGNRLAEVSEMVRDFKSLAVELNVPVVLLSQLSRAGGQR